MIRLLVCVLPGWIWLTLMMSLMVSQCWCINSGSLRLSSDPIFEQRRLLSPANTFQFLYECVQNVLHTWWNVLFLLYNKSMRWGEHLAESWWDALRRRRRGNGRQKSVWEVIYQAWDLGLFFFRRPVHFGHGSPPCSVSGLRFQSTGLPVTK